MKKDKLTVLLISQDTIAKRMAGPAIRYWEFAKHLSDKFDVTLVSPNKPDVSDNNFEIIQANKRVLEELISAADVFVSQRIEPWHAYAARKSNTKIILDSYDPLPFEILEIFNYGKVSVQKKYFNGATQQLLFEMKVADSIICASDKQRDLWIGLLLAIGRISTAVYAVDKTATSLIEVVSFGIQDRPESFDPKLRKKFGLKSDDFVLLWGGGIWNWFDPLTPIKAVAELSKTREDIKLVFLGTKHPHSNTDNSMYDKAVTLAKKLNVIDKFVFFNDKWIDYDERYDYFADADVGISTHFEHLETRFSFRTRCLDYLWAELPLITTVGDSFAEFVNAYSLGLSVPYRDHIAFADAIETVKNNKQEYADSGRPATKKFLQTLGWDSQSAILISHIDNTVSKNYDPLTYRRILSSHLSLFSHRVMNKIFS